MLSLYLGLHHGGALRAIKKFCLFKLFLSCSKEKCLSMFLIYDSWPDGAGSAYRLEMIADKTFLHCKLFHS